MSRVAIRPWMCAAVLSAALCGTAYAGGASSPDASDGSPDSAGISTEDLGGMPSGIDTQSPGTKGTIHSGSGKAVQTNPDQRSARQAVERGEVRPFGWLLKKLKTAVPGDVVKVRLKRHAQNVWTYDVTMLNASGRYVLVSLNAATGAIISTKFR